MKNSPFRFINSKIVFTLIYVFSLSLTFGQSNKSAPYFDFKGKLIVSLSDADMVASAYSNGKLGTPQGSDALSVIRLDRLPQKLKAVEVSVPNSVTGPPSSVAVTADGHYAIAIETRGSVPKGKKDALFKNLETGRRITVIDLSDPDKPVIVQKLEGPKGFKSPQSVSINAGATLVAISFKPDDTNLQTPLIIYRLQNGQLSLPETPVIVGWTAGDELIAAQFHPKENKLALLNSTKAELLFLKVEDDNGKIKLTGWGNKVGTDKVPFKVVFTPDGKYVLINSLTTYGTVAVIKLAMSTDENGIPKHEEVSKATASTLPEGLTVSPDGRWVVTTNLEMSWPASDDPKQGFFSSITLFSLNPETGFLKRTGNFSFDGILPESAVFDNSGKFLAVATFDHYDETRTGGSIDFWRLSTDFNDPTRIEMVKTNYSVPVTRGVHSMVIVR